MDWKTSMLAILAMLGSTPLTATVMTPEQRLRAPDVTSISATRSETDMGNIQDLISGEWHVRELSTGAIPDGQEILLQFSNSQVTIQSTCNRLSASVDFSGSGILFGPVTSSRVDCTPERAETERRFLYEMGRAEKIEISADGALQVYAFGLLLFWAER